MLAVVLAYFNPCGFQSLRDNYIRTLQEFRWQCPAWSVFNGELVYDDAPTVDPLAIRIQGSEKNKWLFQRENLFTKIANDLPPEYDKIMFADADLIYLRPDWYAATEKALDSFDLIQNWKRCHWTSRSGAITNSRFAVTVQRKFPDFQASHPGFTWCFRRDAFERTGWYCVSPAGSDDSVLSWALFSDRPIHECVTTLPEEDRHNAYREKIQSARLRVGYLDGEILHRWHGDRTNRQYVSRYEMWLKSGYSASSFTVEDGLLRWVDGVSPTVVNSMKKYFYRRREDG